MKFDSKLKLPIVLVLFAMNLFVHAAPLFPSFLENLEDIGHTIDTRGATSAMVKEKFGDLKEQWLGGEEFVRPYFTDSSQEDHGLRIIENLKSTFPEDRKTLEAMERYLHKGGGEEHERDMDRLANLFGGFGKAPPWSNALEESHPRVPGSPPSSSSRFQAPGSPSSHSD
ncbi:hypothetical protein IE53DRAFT_380764 [Violaceomyces palustris]|uniref:Uncharacterized protein n=1 Tax=Violaceomyces palustris TaxID=1673888 RepID=A0ACD0NTV2_9BASI|nr:hypothetical protein IE53DRAFT_380764 [Violaceomyces palustris]